jgi:hypothetical protein
MQDLDPTQYDKAAAGGRRRAETVIGARETLPLMAQQDHLRRDLL